MNKILYVPGGIESWQKDPQAAWDAATLEQLLWILGRREVDLTAWAVVLEAEVMTHFGIERWTGHTAPIAASLSKRNPRKDSLDWEPWLKDYTRVTTELAKNCPEDVFGLAWVCEQLSIDTTRYRMSLLENHRKERFTE